VVRILIKIITTEANMDMDMHRVRDRVRVRESTWKDRE
jgi:hypothetical protein